MTSDYTTLFILISALAVGIFIGLAIPHIVESTPVVSNDCINWNVPSAPLNPSYEDCTTLDFCNDTNPIIKQNCRCCLSKYGVCK